MPANAQPTGAACDLHRELSKRGLELCPEDGRGRDDLLQAELAARLNLPCKGFIEALEKSKLSAEDYLHEFLGIATPFAQMFQEIWQYLASQLAPRLEERIKIRFGYGESKTEVDLQQFRVWAECTLRVTRLASVISWPLEALLELFKLNNILCPYVWFQTHQLYHPGVRPELPRIDGRSNHDGLALIVRRVLQEMADFVGENSARDISESGSDPGVASGAPSREGVDRISSLLADLMPAWHETLEQWNVIPDQAKKAAREYYEERIAPLLHTSRAARAELMREALNLLDLPFWKHRWHTYEIWARVKTLEALKDFGVRLMIIDGRLPLDGTRSAVVAHMGANERGFCHVQSRISLPAPHDQVLVGSVLSISTDNPPTNGRTVCIVELDRRNEPDGKQVLEALTALAADCGHSGGVIMANYDNVPAKLPPLPEHWVLVPNFRPGEKTPMKTFQEAVHQAVRRSGMAPPLVKKRFVLLDVSGSMAALYGSAAAQKGLQQAAGLKGIHLFRFNNGLVDDGNWSHPPAVSTSGGTKLGEALRQLYADERFGVPDRLLIVTDGGHDEPQSELSRVNAFRQCRPDDLESELLWLNADF